MKQEFEMTQQEMDDIILINKNKMPVMKFGSHWTGLDLQEQINEYWKTLGDKYGFRHLTVEASAKGKLFFLAEPKSIEIPKTQTEIQMDKYDTIKKIVEQLEPCNYENEAGCLKNNVAFMALKRMI